MPIGAPGLSVEMPKDSDPFDVRVGQRIRAYRLNRGLSQTALGEKIGVSFQQIQKYERGLNRIAIGRLKKVAAVFDTSITALLGEDDKGGAAAVDKVLTEVLSRPYAMRMVWAFDAIDDANKRHALVHFVETMTCDKKQKED
jgi:transcriptional regulator with XRE-family HTH domain